MVVKRALGRRRPDPRARAEGLDGPTCLGDEHVVPVLRNRAGGHVEGEVLLDRRARHRELARCGEERVAAHEAASEEVCDADGRHRVQPPHCGIARKQLRVAGISGILQESRQIPGIAQAEVQPLACDRVQRFVPTFRGVDWNAVPYFQWDLFIVNNVHWNLVTMLVIYAVAIYI